MEKRNLKKNSEHLDKWESNYDLRKVEEGLSLDSI